MQRMNGKLCVVTGAARGIGLAIVEAFLAEGARVVMTDIDLPVLATQARRLGAPHHRLDVAEEADWTALARAWPAIDVLVNNAGIIGFENGAAPQDPLEGSLADWRRVMAVNLDGCFLGCRYALAAMAERGEGSIINLSSRSGLVGVPGAAAYAASKAGVRNHTKSVALYAAGRGWRVRCNSIHPGAILTPMWASMLGEGPGREARMGEFVADTPLHRFGRAEEVAALAVLLASDEAPYITGGEFTVDGGLTAGAAAPPGRS